MKETLEHLLLGNSLTETEAFDVMKGIGNGNYNSEHITAFISHYWYKSVSTNELSGFRNALLELALPLTLDTSNAIDLCGTGGDGKNTFNISTLTAVVVAGAGYKVAKHGNYGVSSISGSSNVLEALGYQFSAENGVLSDQLESCNLTFIHAPLFHPALKEVGVIRKNLGIKTIFNMLGPLVNPSQPKYQMVGVYNLQVARQYQYLFQKLEKSFTIMYNLDGYDEITLTTDARIISNDFDGILTPDDLLSPGNIYPSDIYGGDSVEDAATIFNSILIGNGTKTQNAVVLSNAALAINTLKPTKDFKQCYVEAEEALNSGLANTNFKKLING